MKVRWTSKSWSELKGFPLSQRRQKTGVAAVTLDGAVPCIGDGGSEGGGGSGGGGGRRPPPGEDVKDCEGELEGGVDATPALTTSNRPP